MNEWQQEVGWKEKKKIPSCIFSEKIVLEKGRVATFSFTTPIRVLSNAVKVFESGETKKEVEKAMKVGRATGNRIDGNSVEWARINYTSYALQRLFNTR